MSRDPIPARRHRMPLAALLLLLGWAAAWAEVERIEIFERQAVAGGQAFGLAGPYERLAGKIWFTLDPDAAANARVVDLDKAWPEAAQAVTSLRLDLARNEKESVSLLISDEGHRP